MASDGVYDKINNKDFIKCVWNSLKDSKAPNVH